LTEEGGNYVKDLHKYRSTRDRRKRKAVSAIDKLLFDAGDNSIMCTDNSGQFACRAA
jgi:hypothetical protein